jgi:hypothetical protein
MQTYLKGKRIHSKCLKNVISPQELLRIFNGWMKMMEPQRRNRVVIAKPPEPRIKPAPVIAPRAPQPQPRQRQVAVAPPKQRKPRSPKPLIITITLFHEPNPDGNDVTFARSGTAPADIDVDELEQYVADYFGNTDEEEYEDEDLCEDDEYEE